MNRSWVVSAVAWLVAVGGYLLNLHTGWFIDEVTWVLRPLPLLLLIVWLIWRWPEGQHRRAVLIIALLLFVGGDAAAHEADYFFITMALYWCGLVAYCVWGWQGISMNQLRWLMLIPVICAGLLFGYWLWWVPGLQLEAMIAYNLTLVVMALGILLNARLHWIALIGLLLLLGSHAGMALDTFLQEFELSPVFTMLAYYFGHLGLVLGVYWYREPETAPFGYALNMDE